MECVQLVWNWYGMCGIGMELVWNWYETCMELVWNYEDK